MQKYIPKPVILSCVDYYEKNDIYLKLDRRYFSHKRDLLSRNKISHEEFAEFIGQTRGTDFTRFYKTPPKKKILFRGKLEPESIEHDILPKVTLYLRPNMAVHIPDDKITEILETNKSREFLILDLRNSAGGYLRNCLNLSKKLLPECDIFTAKYKDKTVIHRSDSKYYEFRKIFVFVNKVTASSSEILAYALNANLKNVSLFGERTFGKFCGQDFFTNTKCGFNFAVTTFTWSVNNFSYDNVRIDTLGNLFGEHPSHQSDYSPT
jgi:hypothetical protein